MLVIHLNWWQKFDLRGPRPPTWLFILVCCTRKLLYANMLIKEAETEKTNALLLLFLILVAGGGVEDTRLEANAKDTKKILVLGQGQLFRGETMDRPSQGQGQEARG